MTSRHPPASADVTGAGEVGELAAVPDAIDPLAVLTGATGALVDAVGDVAGVGPPSEQLAAASAMKMGASARAACFTCP